MVSCEAYYQTMKLCQVQKSVYALHVIKTLTDECMFHLIRTFWLYVNVNTKRSQVMFWLLGALNRAGPVLGSWVCRSESGVVWYLSTGLDLMYIKPVDLQCISTCSVYIQLHVPLCKQTIKLKCICYLMSIVADFTACHRLTCTMAVIMISWKYLMLNSSCTTPIGRIKCIYRLQHYRQAYML